MCGELILKEEQWKQRDAFGDYCAHPGRKWWWLGQEVLRFGLFTKTAEEGFACQLNVGTRRKERDRDNCYFWRAVVDGMPIPETRRWESRGCGSSQMLLFDNVLLSLQGQSELLEEKDHSCQHKWFPFPPPISPGGFQYGSRKRGVLWKTESDRACSYVENGPATLMHCFLTAWFYCVPWNISFYLGALGL